MGGRGVSYTRFFGNFCFIFTTPLSNIPCGLSERGSVTYPVECRKELSAWLGDRPFGVSELSKWLSERPVAVSELVTNLA